MELMFSQWVIDLLGILAMLFIWLPLFCGLALIIVSGIVGTYKTNQLRRDFYDSLDDEKKSTIDAYKRIKYLPYKNNEEKK